MIFVRELYGLKYSGSFWRAALAKILKDLDFVSTLAHPDVWIQEVVCEYSFKYYEILFVYVDDIIAVSHKATDVIKEITAFYRAKEGSIKPPDIYLGANIMKVQMPDGREVWGSSSREYVKNAIITVKRLFEEDGEGYSLRNIVKDPFPSRYKALLLHLTMLCISTGTGLSLCS